MNSTTLPTATYLREKKFEIREESSFWLDLYDFARTFFFLEKFILRGLEE